MNPSFSIGVDIGGSHITCAAVNMRTGELQTETLSRATYHHEDPAEDILETWAAALRQTLTKMEAGLPVGIGFAIPGPFDYKNGISAMKHKFKHLFGLHIPEALSSLIGLGNTMSMRFLNDAAAFAVGEAWQGEGKDFSRVVAITLGTGFGSAFVENGIPVVAGDSVPKEGCLWHLPFKDSIADDYISTRWFMDAYEKQTGLRLGGVKELIEKASEDNTSLALFEAFGENLASILAKPLNRFKAEVLVIGGNIVHALALFQGPFLSGLKKEGVSAVIRVSRRMEHAALIGAARLLDDDFYAKVSARLPSI